ncbi:hypothetical protein PFISCL1PPCAC_8750, partial [Pristionchus fissidentatus]
MFDCNDDFPSLSLIMALFLWKGEMLIFAMFTILFVVINGYHCYVFCFCYSRLGVDVGRKMERTFILTEINRLSECRSDELK